MVSVRQQIWTWIVEHREWVFSGIGTAIVTAVITYFLAQPDPCDPTEKLTEPTTWTLVTSWQKESFFQIEVEKFAEDVEQLSQGRLVINVKAQVAATARARQTVTETKNIFQEVARDNSIEMGHGAPYYWSENRSGLELLAAVPFGMAAQDHEQWVLDRSSPGRIGGGLSRSTG